MQPSGMMTVTSVMIPAAGSLPGKGASGPVVDAANALDAAGQVTHGLEIPSLPVPAPTGLQQGKAGKLAGAVVDSARPGRDAQTAKTPFALLIQQLIACSGQAAVENTPQGQIQTAGAPGGDATLSAAAALPQEVLAGGGSCQLMAAAPACEVLPAGVQAAPQGQDLLAGLALPEAAEPTLDGAAGQPAFAQGVQQAAQQAGKQTSAGAAVAAGVAASSGQADEVNAGTKVDPAASQALRDAGADRPAPDAAAPASHGQSASIELTQAGPPAATDDSQLPAGRLAETLPPDAQFTFKADADSGRGDSPDLAGTPDRPRGQAARIGGTPDHQSLAPMADRPGQPTGDVNGQAQADQASQRLTSFVVQPDGQQSASSQIAPVQAEPAAAPQGQTASPAAQGVQGQSTTASPADQIADSIRGGKLRAGGELVVRLNPPELGKVRVVLREEAGQLRAVLQVDSPRTLHELQRETPVLLGNLAESGVQIKRLDLVLNDQSNEGSFAFARDQQAGHHEGGEQEQARSHQASASYEAEGGEPNDWPLQPAGHDGQSINIWI